MEKLGQIKTSTLEIPYPGENFNSVTHSLQTSREQQPVAWFAKSLLVIPKTLAVNAALDSTDLVSKLRAFHNASQTMGEREELKWWVWPVGGASGVGYNVHGITQCIRANSY